MFQMQAKYKIGIIIGIKSYFMDFGQSFRKYLFQQKKNGIRRMILLDTQFAIATVGFNNFTPTTTTIQINTFLYIKNPLQIQAIHSANQSIFGVFFFSILLKTLNILNFGANPFSVAVLRWKIP